jgi:uncharacterized protein YbjT (DUF2867 family)
MYVIAGATGNTGSVVANQLLQRGLAIRALVRDPSKASSLRERGAEVVAIDLGDTKALSRALEGAQGAYLLVPPNMGTDDFAAYQRATIDSIIDALSATRVPQVAFLSSVGAQHPAGTGPIKGLHIAERKLGQLEQTRVASIRAAYFMENVGMSLSMLGQGLFPSFLPKDFPIEMIATFDIGRLAADLLEQGIDRTQVIELAGPSYTPQAIATKLSAMVGRPIEVAEAPIDQIVPTFTSFGMPADLAEMYREMMDGIIRGHVKPEGGHRRVVGTTPIDEVLPRLLERGRPE